MAYTSEDRLNWLPVNEHNLAARRDTAMTLDMSVSELLGLRHEPPENGCTDK